MFVRLPSARPLEPVTGAGAPRAAEGAGLGAMEIDEDGRADGERWHSAVVKYNPSVYTRPSSMVAWPAW